MSVYLRLFHGRDNPEQDMPDWGFDGPVIGPLEYVHVTYMCDIKFACSEDVMRKFFPDYAAEYDAFCKARPNSNCPFWTDHNLVIASDLVKYDGKFYGDWSVSTSPTG